MFDCRYSAKKTTLRDNFSTACAAAASCGRPDPKEPLYVPPPIEVLDISAADERVAAFGRSTYRSRVVGKTMTSPFSILAKVRDGQIV